MNKKTNYYLGIDKNRKPITEGKHIGVGSFGRVFAFGNKAIKILGEPGFIAPTMSLKKCEALIELDNEEHFLLPTDLVSEDSFKFRGYANDYDEEGIPLDKYEDLVRTLSGCSIVENITAITEQSIRFTSLHIAMDDTRLRNIILVRDKLKIVDFDGYVIRFAFGIDKVIITNGDFRRNNEKEVRQLLREIFYLYTKPTLREFKDDMTTEALARHDALMQKYENSHDKLKFVERELLPFENGKEYCRNVLIKK